jgi:hypothetical protein
LLVQRAIHVTAALEGQFEPLGIGRRERGHLALQRSGDEY